MEKNKRRSKNGEKSTKICLKNAKIIYKKMEKMTPKDLYY